MTLTADIEGIEGTISLHGSEEPVLIGARRTDIDEVSIYGRNDHEEVVSLHMDRSQGAALALMVAELVA